MKNKKIFITGMSGTGKSTVISRLSQMGYRAVDLDEPKWSYYNEESDWIWREDQVKRLLDSEQDNLLFISGCPTNQVKFYPNFDLIILLSAPPEILVERLQSRTNNNYGKQQNELEEVLEYLETVEPRLRKIANHEINASMPLEQVVSVILNVLNA